MGGPGDGQRRARSAGRPERRDEAAALEAARGAGARASATSTYVRQIATKWLDWNTLGPLATKYQALIAADVKADTRKLDTFEAFEAGVETLKTFAEQRRAYLLNYK